MLSETEINVNRFTEPRRRRNAMANIFSGLRPADVECLYAVSKLEFEERQLRTSSHSEEGEAGLSVQQTDEANPSAQETSPSAYDSSPSAQKTSSSAYDSSPSALETSTSAYDSSPSALEMSPSAYDSSPSARETSASEAESNLIACVVVSRLNIDNDAVRDRTRFHRRRNGLANILDPYNVGHRFELNNQHAFHAVVNTTSSMCR